jgi:CRP-like cAMP-binding protein
MKRQKALLTQKLHDSLIKKIPTYQITKVSKNDIIYNAGEKNDKIYIIENGQIKLLIPPLQNKDKEYTLAIYNPGDFFGELSISPLSKYSEIAIATTDTSLRTISSNTFLAHLDKESLLQDFIQYLIIRIIEQQQIQYMVISQNSKLL